MAEDLFATLPCAAPPIGEEERIAWLRLIRSRRVGITTFNRLLGEHGSASAALKVLPDIARTAGVQGYEICPEGVVLAELKAARKIGAELICRGDSAYPSELTQIVDAPPLFWARGNLELLSRPKIALVGARNASSLGTRMARRLAAELGEEGYIVTSGLARGIDTAAHHAALPTGTIGVLAGGVDVIYPLENLDLATQIAKTGVLLSEQPIGMQPMARHFPMRNRIISGLSDAVVVVEAALKSGSLITARNALDQGRDVMAVPGHPIDMRASGCNALIRDGAVLIRNARDVLDALPRTGTTVTAAPPEPTPAEPRRHPPRRGLSETTKLHSEILTRLAPCPLAEDQLLRDMNVPADALNPELTTLELDGRITRDSGGLLALIR